MLSLNHSLYVLWFMKGGEENLKIIKDKFKKDILEQRFKGNYSQCAKTLGVEIPQLHRFLTSDSQAGAKLLGAICSYCEAEGLNFRDYIFLPSPSTAVYRRPTGTCG